MKSMKRLGRAFFAFAIGAAILMQPLVFPTLAQAQEATQQLHLKGLSHQPTKAASEALLNPNDTVLLLLDHQTGLFQTVNDIPVADLRRNTVALAKIADQTGIPIIYTDRSLMASDATLARTTAAGIIPVTTNTILSETHRTWNRPDAAKWGALYSELVPEYRSVVESYIRAQKVKGKAKAAE